jgi:pimeloyl-ACP methyl ester carboxylesterase
MDVDVNGMRLWFDADGLSLVPSGSELRQRPTVVLLHGGPGSFDHSYFKPHFEALAEVAQVVYLDLPGHGRSEWGDPADWNYEHCADLVRGFCDTTGIHDPVVLGHSLGALVAVVYGARHPRHPSALVLQSGVARFDVPRLVEGFRRAGGDEVAAIADRAYGGEGEPVSEQEWERCWRLFGPHVPTDDEKARMPQNHDLNARGGELLRGFDVLGQIGAIDCPTLVCVGELDPVTPVEAARELAAALPNARLHVIEGAGHFTWLDAPDRYWPFVKEFVTSVGGRRQ